MIMMELQMEDHQNTIELPVGDQIIMEIYINMELPMEDQMGNGIAVGGSDYNGGLYYHGIANVGSDRQWNCRWRIRL